MVIPFETDTRRVSMGQLYGEVDRASYVIGGRFRTAARARGMARADVSPSAPCSATVASAERSRPPACRLLWPHITQSGRGRSVVAAGSGVRLGHTSQAPLAEPQGGSGSSGRPLGVPTEASEGRVCCGATQDS